MTNNLFPDSTSDQLTECIDNILSEKDVEFYQRHGYYISERIFSDEQILEANYGIRRFYSGEYDYLLPVSGGYLNWVKEHGDVLRLNDYVSLQNEEVKNLIQNPILSAIAARLSKTRQIRLFHDQLICKPPLGEKDSSIGWHIDSAYWRTCTSQEMLTAWIPLVPYSIEAGPLCVIEGSHRWKGNKWMATFNNKDLRSLETRISSQGNNKVKVPILIEPGCVSFHHCKTIHGSASNRSPNMRLALTVHFQDEGNHYRSNIGGKEQKALHINDVLCRSLPSGDPDYSDPDICPILWQEK